MESNLHDFKSSSEETEQLELANDDDTGIGRSYECAFCKRGFTTAQALGGHMNIHRKDRTKPKPSSVPSVSSKVDEEYASYRGYPPIHSYQPYNPTAHNHHHEVNVNYQTFFPSSSACGVRSPYVQHIEDCYVQGAEHLNPFGEDQWRRNLDNNLQISPSYIDGNKEKGEDGSEEDELDLELRLGHDP